MCALEKELFLEARMKAAGVNVEDIGAVAGEEPSGGGGTLAQTRRQTTNRGGGGAGAGDHDGGCDRRLNPVVDFAEKPTKELGMLLFALK